MNLENAYKKCREIATGHYENFPVASFLFPKKNRKYIYSIYAFARVADDIADSDRLIVGEKLKRLDLMWNNLEKIENGENVEDEIFFALTDTIKTLNIPVKEFKDLLTAFKQDSVKQRYDRFEELLEYSKYSANPIGHLVLYVSGFKDKHLFDLSDKICTALQLANFWQDVSLDLKIGRVYIPKEEMKKFNYNYDMLFEGIENSNFLNLMKSLVNNTKLIFQNGKRLENELSGRLKYEFRTIYRGGMDILRKIDKIDYRVLSKRVNLDSTDKIKLLFKIFNKI
ncbi:MAG: squalene synthase HpnC [Ignavibacteriae bacterium]|nr:squalene synthase HpnC [Ignavibacteriota bacterium]